MAFPQQMRGFKVPGGGGRTADLQQMGANWNMGDKAYRRSMWAPAYTLSALYQSPEAQSWLNPADLASTMGVESALAGREALGRQAGTAAGQQGLGPGFAAGMEQEAMRASFSDIASALQEAQMLQQDRQFMGARDLAGAVMEGQRAAFMRNQAKRAKKGGSGGLIGSGAGALIGGALGMVGGPVGMAVGAGIGGSLGGSIGQSVDQMNGRFSPAPNFSSLMMLPFMMGGMGGAPESTQQDPTMHGQTGRPGGGPDMPW